MKNKLLLLILLLAAILRFGGIYPGHNRWHSDESIIYSTALDMVTKSTLDPKRYDYPATDAFINAVFFKFVFIPLQWFNYYLHNISKIADGIMHLPISPLEARRTFFTFIVGDQYINPMYWGRIITAFFALGCVWLTYCVGLNLFSKKVGLIAALLLTFNFKHVVNSHIGLPDIYNCFFLLLSILTTIKLWQFPNRKYLLLSGIAAGMALSAKYQLFAIPPLLLVLLYNRSLKLQILLSLLSIPLVFLLTNPYFFINLPQALGEVADVARKYGVQSYQINLYPLSYLYHIDYGPPEFILVCIGLMFVFRKSFSKALFLWSVIFPFMFLFLYYSKGGFYVRNFITITPILLICASVFLASAKRNWLIILSLPLILFVPAKNSIINAYTYATTTWNYQKVTDWMSKNIPPDTVIAAHPFDPPTGWNFKKTEFEIDGNYSLAEHKVAGASYALINLDWAGNPFYFWMGGIVWSKPVDLLRNTYHGLSAEELFRYKVFMVTKPWQAPDSNLILAKLPSWPQVSYKPLKSFDFKANKDWTSHGIVSSPPVVTYEASHLVFTPSGSTFPVSRITSPLVHILPGHLYKVTADLKSDKLLSSHQRDGFLRLDFYESNPDLEKIGIVTTVSPRVHDSQDWQKMVMIEKAPEGSQFLAVSLQGNSNSNTFQLENVKIEESVSQVERLSTTPPYISGKVDLDLLYPNSHGNL